VLTSCGDSKASGTGQFATVFASASPPASALDSDVATWVDATTLAKAPACGANSVANVSPDDATFVVTSAAYTVPNTGSSSTIATSDLIIDKITLTLTPADTQSPALPSLYQTQFPSAGQRIVVGANNVTVRIASDELKSFFRSSNLGNLALDCSNPSAIYSYRAVVSFEALEVNTNRVGTITPPGFLLVKFSDFVDK
jgi:hypothetical protein